MAENTSGDLRSFASKTKAAPKPPAPKKSKKQKKSTLKGNDRRNMWLIILTTLLVIVSIIGFTPLQEKINQGLDIQGGLSVVLTATNNDGSAIDDETMEKSRAIIENRVNALGASETSVQVQGNNQILVQIPGETDAESALRIIGTTGKLEFARLDSFTDSTVKSKINSGNYITEVTASDDYGNSFSTGQTQNLSVPEGTYTPLITGENIQRVTVAQTQNGTGYEVDLTLDSEGTSAFAEATKALAPTNGKIVILLDGEVQSAPAVQSEILTGSVSITGDYTSDEAHALQTVLESGSLPVSFSFSQSQVVGPTLGQGALYAGLLVAIIGLLLVMFYLFFFYRGLGLINAGAILVFSVLYLGLLAGLSALGLFSLTLSGVAGIVLTIGMAADSSVLTVERFREEIRMGRSVKAASMTGVSHAIRTSIDADLVTLVSALCLFFLASASVKGFGLTLSLGILCDIVMMLIFKAPLVRLLAPRAIKKNPGLWGIKDCQNAAEANEKLAGILGQGVENTTSAFAVNAQLVKDMAIERAGAAGEAVYNVKENVKGRFIKKDINFLGLRKYFLIFSAFLIVVSFAAVGIKGMNFGIEFVGGTSITYANTGDITTDQVRAAFQNADEPDAVIQTTQENGENGFLVRIASDSAEASAATASTVAKSLGISADNVQVNTIGPDWGSSVIQASVIAFLVSLVLIICYIAIRFRDPKMGTIAVVALLHDLIIVVGVYALVGREMTPNTVAALLTILGYSLYDTVVVFHRITENQKELGIRTNFMTMANHSVNQVIIRSINTTLTSLIPVLAMLLFGSETLKDFAFAMTIGLLTGAYSSVAIASPLYSMWKTREPENAKLIKRYGAQIGAFSFREQGKPYAAPSAPAAVAVAAEGAAATESVPVQVTVTFPDEQEAAAKAPAPSAPATAKKNGGGKQKKQESNHRYRRKKK